MQKNKPGDGSGSCVRVMGVDTSLRSSGVAVIEARGSMLKAVDFGLIKNSPARSLSYCLACIYKSIEKTLDDWQPHAVAVEGIFYCKNARTALVLGQARGVVIAACAIKSIPVYEYSARRVKQAVAGFGGVNNEQVQKMVAVILGLCEKPREDEADALALAICHANSTGRLMPVAAKEI